jgi:hypothetical protein
MMLPNEIVNSEMQHHGELVHFKTLAVAKGLALKLLLFILFHCLSAATIAQKAPPAKPFERFDGCVLEPDEWTDGDSFRVRLPDNRLETLIARSAIPPAVQTFCLPCIRLPAQYRTHRTAERPLRFAKKIRTLARRTGLEA